MKNAFRTIFAIAATERMLLYRTPKFWVLAGAGVAFMLFLLTAVTIASILDSNPPGEFMLTGTDAYLALYFFSYVLSALIIFVAGDFRNAEEKARLDEVMLSRPMTTANLVIGKYLGVVSAMILLNLGLIALSTIGRIFKMVFAGAQFDIVPALQYFGIVTLPSILFMTAFVFFLISLLRLQLVSILVSLGYAASILIFFRHKFYGLVDYACFFAPIFASDFIGFGDLKPLLWQRAFFVSLGMALLCFSILLYPRLRQSTLSHRLVQIGAVAFLGGAVWIAHSIVASHTERAAAREEAIAYQQARADSATCRISHAAMNIRLMYPHQPLQVQAAIAVDNPNRQALRHLIFALSNALHISELHFASGNTPRFTHRYHLLEIELERPLAPGERDTLFIAYAGRIDADAFMLDRLPEGKGILERSDGPWVKGEISAWVDERFVMLPPQSGWYPTPGTIAGHPFSRPRRKSFFTAEIAISLPEGNIAVTQGRETAIETRDGLRTSKFMCTTPVSGLSLHAGPYTKLARRIGDTNVALYFLDSHLPEYLEFADVADTCYQAIQEMLDEFEQVTGLAYPYPKLAYVEVPAHTQIYPSRHGVENILEQPQIILLDETFLPGRRIKEQIKRRQKRARRRGRDDTPARIKRDTFVDYATTLLFGERWRDDHSLLSPTPNYFSHQVDWSDPILQRSLDLYLYEQAERHIKDTFFPDRWELTLSRNDVIRQGDRSSEWMLNSRYDVSLDSLMLLIERKSLSAMRPQENPDLYRAFIDFKGAPIMRMLQERMGEKPFQRALQATLARFRYARLNREDFIAMLQRFTSDSIRAFFDTWFDQTTFPGYQLTRARAEKLDTGGMKIMYQAIVRVRNGEKGDGFVRLKFATRDDKIWRSLALKSYEEKELRIALRDEPKYVEVVPYFSRNRGEIRKQFTISNRIRRGSPQDTSFAVVSATDSLTFVLDDQDAGFFTPVDIEVRYLRPPVRGSSWRPRTDAAAFGRYFFGWKMKRAGHGDYPARWETRVPRDGDYELSLYLPVNKSWYTRQLSSKFKIRITDAETSTILTLQPLETADNWLPLGRYPFSTKKPAVIELLDEGNGYLIADAVRWEFVE